MPTWLILWFNGRFCCAAIDCVNRAPAAMPAANSTTLRIHFIAISFYRGAEHITTKLRRQGRGSRIWHAFRKTSHEDGENETSTAALGAASPYPRGCPDWTDRGRGGIADRPGSGDRQNQTSLAVEDPRFPQYLATL